MASDEDIGSIEIQGLKELNDKLEGLGNELAGKALYAALNFAAAPIVKEARDRAPQSEEAYRRYMSSGQGESTRNGRRRGRSLRARRGEGQYVTQAPGALKRSIRQQRLTKKQRGSAAHGEGASVGIFIKNKRGDPPPYYWYFIEYGTSKMAAAPFLRPAFDNNVELAVTRFKTKLSERIDHYTR